MVAAVSDYIPTKNHRDQTVRRLTAEEKVPNLVISRPCFNWDRDPDRPCQRRTSNGYGGIFRRFSGTFQRKRTKTNSRKWIMIFGWKKSKEIPLKYTEKETYQIWSKIGLKTPSHGISSSLIGWRLDWWQVASYKRKCNDVPGYHYLVLKLRNGPYKADRP